MATTETQRDNTATTIPAIGWESAGVRMTTEEIRVVAESEIYQTPLLAGFELPLAQLLAEADKWNK